MVTDITRLLEQPLAVAPSPLKMRQHANRDETQYKHSARRLVYAATSEDARKVISALSTWFGGLVHLECLPDLVAMDTTLATSADGGADAGADAGASADIVAAKAKDAAAGQHFHILPVTAVVQFPAELEEMTVESLAELPGTAQAWRDCRAAGPPPGERMHLEQWQATHDAAVELLLSAEWAQQEVAVCCELQVLLETVRTGALYLFLILLLPPPLFVMFLVF